MFVSQSVRALGGVLRLFSLPQVAIEGGTWADGA
jgi:hypothetical protein